MLQPREADLPILFFFLVVLPLVTHFLLGKWNESAKKKARIGTIAQLVTGEASQVEEKTSTHVLPVLPSTRTGFHECARCCASATRRCSRCKSVRYCSGKCQIIHWRQGHKHECQQWHVSSLNVSAGLPPKDKFQHKPSIVNKTSPSLANGIGELTHCNRCTNIGNTSQDSDTGKPSDKGVLNTLTVDGDVATHGRDHNYIHGASARTLLTNHFTEVSLKDAPVGHKLVNENLTASSGQVHLSQGRNAVHHNKSAAEANKGFKQSDFSVFSSLLDLDKHVITECQNCSNVGLEEVDIYEVELCSNETVHLKYPAEDSARGSIMYRTDPYTLGHTVSFSQNLAENDSREYLCQGLDRNRGGKGSGTLQKNDSSNIHYLQGLNENPNVEGRLTGSKKNSQVLKWNIGGLISENKKKKGCQMLFPYDELVKFFQCNEGGIYPRGLLNCGNSCYANAVLQCLTGTKPLMVYLLRRLHSRTCYTEEWCLMCELEEHVSMLCEGGGPLSPTRILSNMRNIGCRMGGGNQEDAHEFLRLLVMSMQSVCLEGLGGEKEVDPRLQETTLIQQIFGGRLKSKVKCLRCHHESERYESIMDLTLEIYGWVESLEDALTQFTAPEDLDGENMYKCGRCLSYVKARKQLSVHEVPNILTIVLKRFQTGKYGKINKCVTFPDMLDMIPFVSGTADHPPLYMLYAVVVHLDTFNASFSGHYISYVKDLQGTWYRIDDSEVKAVPWNQVMSEGAYMLFYSRSFPRPPKAYTEKRLLRSLACAPKSQKTSKHWRQRRNYFENENEDFTDQAAEHISRSSNGNILHNGRTCPNISNSEFSDAISSDWSLFSSSDDSSFTTESTRDSFSLDATISSLFSPLPVYSQEYVQSNAISCTKYSACRPQTRFFSENTSFVDQLSPTQ
ncbi:ubiquitin carboxyl-terminal hydrolase 15-like [Canna indica]|uniref:ubiquitinyl hydrolase 1 n=1 Tax=Canna indica TaxID=4628 RepID=A0AAQ3JXI3_9LILI|nr:ubiquitin carboxyl-terminal hydrolase 15-like [Canna indica]